MRTALPVLTLRATKSDEREGIGGFSEPSKMPWLGWSLPAQACKTGAKLHEVPGSVCHGCYALKGNYSWPHVKAVLAERLAKLDSPDWAADMTRFIKGRARRFLPGKGGCFAPFRWHDSGDLQGVAHLRAICGIAEATMRVRFADGKRGRVRHWLPTREYGIVTRYVRSGGEVPSNLVIRLSAHMVDGAPPEKLARELGVKVSTVHTGPDVYKGASLCPAYTQGGKCGECRTCWGRAFHVSYPRH